MLKRNRSSSRKPAVSLPAAEPVDAYALGEDSVRLIAGLDRASLGSFIVPADVLSAVDFTYRIMAHRNNGETDHAGSLGRANSRARTLCRDKEIYFNDAAAEVLFWWNIFDEPLLSSLVTGVELDARVSELSTVYAHPEMHDFFVAGIWDVAFISRCLADGVDPELAGSLAAA